MAEELKVLTICGSLRKKSFNHALVRALPPLAPQGMTLSEAPPFDGFPFYNQDLQDASGFPAPVVAFADAVRAADGVIIVTPEYNWTIPGALKNAFDWVSRMKDQPFKDKPVALQSASGGPLGGSRMQYHLRQSFTYLNAFMFGTPEIFVSFAPTKFDKDTLELTDQPTKDILKTQLAAFAAFIQRVKA
ncbi:MAG: NAD(P)H-dependent oxidoreductase [Proteobacteria bacterium]|nr:NAD(P)H-dependent oxidoreductase [Pseudomonadota bacterium]